MDMTTNWSFTSNFSLHPKSPYCSDSSTFISFFAFFATKYVIILPFAILVLYLGHQRWRQQRSFKTMSQSDLITYHIAFMQLFGVLGLAFYICGLYAPQLFFMGACVLTLVNTGELLFHVVVCFERYLAVVHPITYLELKNRKGAKIRHICVGGVWLSSFGWIFVIALNIQNNPTIPFFCLVGLCFVIVSFCSLSVLRALIRPGPGEAAGQKERVDQSKQKAFHTIMVITGALWLLFVGNIICIALESSELLSYNERCWVMAFSTWFSLPSSLVVPLLFLHRAGKLRCCCTTAD